MPVMLERDCSLCRFWSVKLQLLIDFQHFNHLVAMLDNMISSTDRTQRASQRTQPSRTTGTAPILFPMYLTLQAPILSPLNMEEMRFLTLHTASSLCQQEMPANVKSQVRKPLWIQNSSYQSEYCYRYVVVVSFYMYCILISCSFLSSVYWRTWRV